MLQCKVCKLSILSEDGREKSRRRAQHAKTNQDATTALNREATHPQRLQYMFYHSHGQGSGVFGSLTARRSL